MDKVRLGRVLGAGTRTAAKTLIDTAQAAAQAAAAPEPRTATPPAQKPLQQPVRAVPAAEMAGRVMQEAGKRKGKFIAPLRRFSSVLWLEVTGTFFAIFACILGNQVWKHRGSALLPPSSPDAQHLYLYFGFGALFLYFTVSSFVRARRRERR